MTLKTPLADSPLQSIAYVAEAIKDHDAFQHRAKDVADKLGPSALAILPAYFHDPPSKPASLSGHFEGLGAWLYVCQQAIFEVFYHLRSASIDLLREVAFGDYDWTQEIALRTLCRFAQEGVESEALIDEICSQLDAFRYEVLMPTVAYLCGAGVPTPTLKQSLEGLIAEFMADGDPVNVLDVLEQYAEVYPEPAQAYSDFLMGLVRGEGLADRHPVLDGALISTQEDGEEEVIWGPGGPPPEDIHSIRAAFLLHRIGEEREEVEAYLRRWQAAHPDAEMRARIEAYLAKAMGF